LNDIHTISVWRTFFNPHCLTTFDAVQQIDEWAFVVVGVSDALHFFAFSAISTSNAPRLAPIAQALPGGYKPAFWWLIRFD
jgi:hypothetical protein